MANFMEQMYADNSPEGKRKKEDEERQLRLNRIKVLARDVCSAIRGQIKDNWDKYHFEGWITLLVYDGNNIGFDRILNKKPRTGVSYARAKTYEGYLQIRDGYEAEVFTDIIKETMADLGVMDFDISKKLVDIESVDSYSFLKLRKKEYYAYIFHVTINW